ncbi:hypothetical protein C7M84_020961 [Penaeus vannamei]|uniref:RNA-directed DNA polymerase n=1 Tax=Penaeus vannamei TaxID=6689 RepID=A0A3R7SHB1_PENVA|nr:hypothetical protein C7M84_020961 [Penaeus vannamei]
MLSQSRMIPGQTPLDYYQQVEMAVFQGVRDYPHEIGDAEGLIRRTFKAGLPERLQRQLSLHTFSSARAMAERVQCAWNDWTGLRMSLPLATQVSRHCGGQASQPVASPPSSSTFTYPPTTRPLPAESVPGLDFYSDNPFSVQATQATQTGSPGHSHNFDNERVSRVLLGNDNFRQCALRSGAPIIGPRHHFLPAEETFHVSPQVVSPKGRPTIQVRVNSKVLTAFVDTDSLPCSQDEALAVNENHSVNSDTPVNLATLASAVLREYQLKEDLWKEIIEFLEGKKLPRRALPASLHEFELDDGVLYHLKSLPDRIIRQVCVPHSLQSQALHLAHDHPTAAHPGALRTYHNLQNSYFFPNMFRLCKWYVQHCTACQHRKGSRERAEMQCRPPPSGPLELVSADLMDLRASVGGYRYVLSIVDHHSRYLQLVPLRNKTAETVLRGFYDHFITLFGPPRQIMTDNGGEFANEQWQEVCRQLEIRCSFTIAYHPSSNGLVERTNRVVKDALAMLVADKPGRWPLYLTSVRLAINSAIHRSVGDQPLYLLTGKMALFPRGLTNQVTTDTNLRVQQLAKARQLAIAASLRSREANAQAHNRKVRSTWQPEEGALVLRRDFTGGALQDRWQGPCRVIKQIGPVVFEVKDLQPPYRIVKQHRDQLKCISLLLN